VADSRVTPYLKPYLDSSVFIAWIRGEEKDGVKRYEIVEHIMNDASDGKHPIIISGWTFAEVHKVKGDGKQHLSSDEDERILAYFEHDFIQVVEVDRFIGEEANRFCRLYNIRPGDAIHLACALRAHCDVALFWDRPFIAAVTHDQIRIEEPRILSQRQGSIFDSVSRIGPSE
jgi:predicted nucleic acid-binding protein